MGWEGASQAVFGSDHLRRREYFQTEVNMIWKRWSGDWYRVPLRKCFKCYKNVTASQYYATLTEGFSCSIIHIIVFNNDMMYLMISQERGLIYDHISGQNI